MIVPCFDDDDDDDEEEDDDDDDDKNEGTIWSEFTNKDIPWLCLG